MYPYIHIVLPSYTLLAFVGGCVTLIFIYFRLEKFEILFTEFLKMFALCVLGGFLGSKLMFVVTQIPWLVMNFSFKNVFQLLVQGGYVFYGGLFGVLYTIFTLTKKDKDKRNRILKMIVPAIPLFHSFGRIGCFLAGCCYGKKLFVPIVLEGILEFWRIPVQLFEALFEFVLFIILLLIGRKKLDSNLLNFYLITYAIFRFINEFFRGDEIRGIYFGYSTAQWVSMAILLYYISKAVRFRKNNGVAQK